jgi:nicotinate phosphoribosyltransferase
MSSPPLPPLFTDLYELTMLQAYWAEAMTAPAVFDLFARKLPPGRNFLLACGLVQVLDYLEAFAVSSEDIDYLRSLGTFRSDFLDRLRTLRFTGNVYAVPEGTPVFAHEPLLTIEAPMPQAQVVETAVLNLLHYPTLVASKGQRVVQAAQGRTVVDFGARRSHGIDAAIACARALYLAGYVATSNVEAGRRYGIPVTGTMAHSYVQAHDSEPDAFVRFAEHFPGTTLLVDTYDTLDAVRRVIELRQRLGKRFKVGAVRLDSGDLGGARQGQPQAAGCGRTDRRAHHGQWRSGRVRDRWPAGRWCADRRLWRRYRGRCRGRPAVPGCRLQAGGLRRA